MERRMNLTYNLDNKPKFMLEQYNLVEEFFKCSRNVQPFKLNYKKNYDKCYRFHVLRHRVM